MVIWAPSIFLRKCVVSRYGVVVQVHAAQFQVGAGSSAIFIINIRGSFFFLIVLKRLILLNSTQISYIICAYITGCFFRKGPSCGVTRAIHTRTHTHTTCTPVFQSIHSQTHTIGQFRSFKSIIYIGNMQILAFL